jgi:Peptidase family M48
MAKTSLSVGLIVLAMAAAVSAQDPVAKLTTENSTAPSSGVSLGQVVDRAVIRENALVAQMQHVHPLVETYIQNLTTDHDHEIVPKSDNYFIGRLDMSDGADDQSFLKKPGFSKRVLGAMNNMEGARFLPRGFAQMVLIDDDFRKEAFDFHLVRKEFLGEVRCFVVDVQPKKGSGKGRFVGRIWVEDQDYNIVRFNGTYTPSSRNQFYFHFDSWRLNLQPGVWLPAYVYSEETGGHATKAFNFKSQTRLWGYDLRSLAKGEEFAQIQVDSTVKDQSEVAQDAGPLEAQRLWERQAEDNAIDRLERVGLLAPEGEVDKVLQTVVNNLMVTNNLQIVPDVRCRVLLTSPLESFTIGHTIVVSRGLLDVLPDEPSLAMVLAHELGHIVLGHRIDTELAFNDRMFFPDEKTYQRLDFNRDPVEEEAADNKAIELLKKSPYNDKLASAGLFLRALQERAPDLKSLIRPHLGNGLAKGDALRMSTLLVSAPQLDDKKTDQIAALPLGGRIKLDPWSDRVELMKAKPVHLFSPQDKMPFEVTPFFPHLSRLGGQGNDKIALVPTKN